MRKSGIALGLAVAMCAFGVVAAPALAFGKFYASIKGKTLSETEPGLVKGRGEVARLRLGPYTLECKKVRTKGKVTSEGPSESFFQEVSLSGCITWTGPGKGSGIEEGKRTHITLAMEFLSNFAARVGEGESEYRIAKPSEVEFGFRNSKCRVVVPEQSVPMKQRAGVEYEAAVPETEEQLLEAPRLIEKYGEYRKRLAFELNLKHLKTKIKPNALCRYKGKTGEEPEPEDEGKYNAETGYVEFFQGLFLGNLEHIELKGGNVWFEE
jgi:hypothetical protein